MSQYLRTLSAASSLSGAARRLPLALALAISAGLSGTAFAQDAAAPAALAAPGTTLQPAPSPNTATTTPLGTPPITTEQATATGQSAVQSGQSAVPLIKVPDVADAGLADLRNQQSAQMTPISLEEAVIAALQNNPSPQAARAALNAALARIGIAKSAGGVQVDLSGNGSLQKGYLGNGGRVNTSSGNTFLGFNDSTSLSLDASLPLYTGGRVKASRKVAEANARAQLAAAQQTEQDLAAQTILAYLTILQNDQLLGVAESNLQVARERRRVAGVRFDAGAAARLEVLRADSDLATAQQARISAANNLAQSTAVLNTLLARAPETPLRIQPITALELPAVARFPLAQQATLIAAGGEIPTSADLRNTALGTLPSLQSSRESVVSAEENVNLQKAQRKPSVSFSLGGLLANPAQSIGRFILSLGIGAAQNIFSSGRLSSQVEQAQAQLQQARFSLTSSELQVGNVIESSLLTLDTARKQQASADVAVIAAQEALRAAQLAYSAGAGTALDVTDAQNALVQAQTNAVNTRFTVAQAQVQLAAATSQSSTGRTTSSTGSGSTFSSSSTGSSTGVSTVSTTTSSTSSTGTATSTSR